MLSFFLEIKPNKCTEIGWSLNTEVLVWVPWVLCLVTTVLTCNILRVFLSKIWCDSFLLLMDLISIHLGPSIVYSWLSLTLVMETWLFWFWVFYCEHNSLRIEQYFTCWIMVSLLGSKWWHRSFVSFLIKMFPRMSSLITVWPTFGHQK